MKKSFPAELVYQVFSLLIAFILVHAVYVTLIRPQANAFLEQQAANMLADPEYVQQRSFYVVIKDYEQETCFILIVLAAMGLAEDELSKLGEVVQQEDGNIIKLPNIS
ncbi:MAG: hypothetical protein U9P11_07390, partial [Pseudomonadota bacterium]|nr:hypothetical protein [Pseudomonadota bacterium]